MATTITPVQLLVTALEMESARSRLLVRKLGFLKRTLSNGATGVGAAATRSMVYNVCLLCLAKKYRKLEERFGSLHKKKKNSSGDVEQINM